MHLFTLCIFVFELLKRWEVFVRNDWPVFTRNPKVEVIKKAAEFTAVNSGGFVSSPIIDMASLAKASRSQQRWSTAESTAQRY